MYQDKRVLLIAGGGTLGTAVARELLDLGATVEVICPEEKVSHNEKLIFHQSMATRELLESLFAQKHYHGIVNFINYPDPEEYKKIHPFLIANTDHLIFLSSYRVYADQAHPITEDAPRLLDVSTDTYFLEKENYAISKAKLEDYLYQEHSGEPWTIVRPVISFSQKRLDLLMYSGLTVVKAARDGKELCLPEMVRNFSAGWDWAGNSGKLIAHLLFKKDAIGECFTIYSGHNLTWGQVAELYQTLTGVKVRWCEESEYLDNNPKQRESDVPRWMWNYDRRYNRDIDCSKVLRVTGLRREDFESVENGLRYELSQVEL